MIRHGLSRFLLFSAAAAILLLAGERQSFAAGDYWKGMLALQQGDCDTALTEFRALSEANDGQGSEMMGEMHLQGTCVAIDSAKAIKFFEAAAELGSESAAFRLSWLYQGNGGVPADRERAQHWSSVAFERLSVAAEGGSSSAAYTLGTLLSNPDTPGRNMEKAAYWLQRAALKKHRLAQVRLGAIRTVEGKMIEAVMWGTLASGGGDQRAELLLKVLRKEASVAEFAEGEARATRCRASVYTDCASD